MVDSTQGTAQPAQPARGTVAGAIWMVAACACFASMAGLIRYISRELHPFEIAFFRNLFGFFVMLPWLLRVGLGGLKTKRIGLYTLRGVTGIGALLSWFWAVSILPLANATALSFTSPLFGTVLAALVLSEVVRARRWAALGIGFVGALIILRPGFQTIGLPEAMVLMSAVMMAASATTIKILSRTESPNAIVIYMVIYLTPMALIPALFVWQTPSWEMLGWLFVLGLVATGGHQCLTRSFAAAEASAVLPFDFSRLIFAATVGYLFFDQVPDIWSGVGAAVIVASSVYIARREALIARSERLAARTAAERDGR
jgi:drug/metabolite transporter (DMT)-like permease